MTTLTWTAGTSGYWSVAPNWSPAQVPTAGDTVLIDQAGAYLIALNHTASVGGLTLNDASGELSVAGSLDTANTLAVSAGTLGVSGRLNTGTLSNAGTVQVSGSLNASGFTNTGTLLNTGSVSLQTDVASASLNRIGGTGTLRVSGTVMNAGATLDGTSLSQESILSLGTVQGGTVANLTDPGATTLDGVTWRGTLQSSGALTIRNGLTVTAASGSGPGTLVLSGNSSRVGYLNFVGSQSINNVGVQAVAAGGNFGALNLVNVNGGTLTLGSGAHFTQEISPYSFSESDLTFAGTGTIRNYGTIVTSAKDAGVIYRHNSVLSLTNADFQNYGLIDAYDFSIQGTTLGVPQTYYPGLVTGTISAATFVNHASGTIEVGQSFGNAALTIAGTTDFTNDGTLLTQDSRSSSIAGGTIDIQALLAGDGIVALNGGGTVEVGSATSNTQTIDFAGPGTLILDQPAFVPAIIDNFGINDRIQLGVSATAVSYTSGDLKLAVPGSTIDLAITGTHSLSDFIVNTQSAGTTIQLACFATGTRLATSRGLVPVEHLREGDAMVLADAAGTLPVVWIGHRALDCRRHPRPEKVWPVRIAAGAFAPGVPQRDIYLSPDHAVFVRDVLVPAKCLVNGSTIVQQQVDRIVYWHIELERHAVLLAEGLTVESLLPDSDRAEFDNGDRTVVTLHPDFLAWQWEGASCARLVVTGAELQDIRAGLARRAAQVQRAA